MKTIRVFICSLATIAVAACGPSAADLAASTSTAEAIASSTAEAIASSTAHANATSTGQAISSMTALAEATSTASAAETATVQARSTAQAQSRASATAEERANITATASAANALLSTGLANARLEFGPVSGRFEHNHSDEYLVHRSALVLLNDFIAECEFENPYSASWHDWSFGFGFRMASWDMFYMLVVTSDREWVLGLVQGDDWTDIGYGDVPGLRVAEGEWNSLKLLADGNRGYLYINGRYIAELNLSRLHAEGGFFAGSGLFIGDEVGGYSTPYRGFRVWSLH